MRPSRPFNSLRDWRIGLPTSCVSVRASSVLARDDRSRNARSQSRRLLHRQRGPARLGDARLRVFGRDRSSRCRRATSAIAAPFQGFTIFIGRRRRSCAGWRGAGSRRAADGRRGTRVVLDGWNSGCHWTPNTYDGPLQRIASTTRSGSDQASTTSLRPRSFTAWWWIELVLRQRRARVELRERRARHDRDRVGVLLVDLPVAVVERVRHLRAQVLPQRPAHRDVDHLRAAAHAEHRLALRDERVEEPDLVVVADAVAVPLGRSAFSP